MTFYKQHAPSGNDSVATSPELWRPLERAAGGFDLDPAAGCEPEPIATERYTEEDDGLHQPWHGTIWLNPPFSNKGEWYKRLVDHYNSGRIDRAVVIGPADTSTEWFHDWFSTADMISFLEGRDHYEANLGNGGSPSFCTMVGVWNLNDELEAVLADKGLAMKPVRNGKQLCLG